jgi:hypothetical protein
LDYPATCLRGTPRQGATNNRSCDRFSGPSPRITYWSIAVPYLFPMCLLMTFFRGSILAVINCPAAPAALFLRSLDPIGSLVMCQLVQYTISSLFLQFFCGSKPLECRRCPNVSGSYTVDSSWTGHCHFSPWSHSKQRPPSSPDGPPTSLDGSFPWLIISRCISWLAFISYRSANMCSVICRIFIHSVAV